MHYKKYVGFSFTVQSLMLAVCVVKNVDTNINFLKQLPSYKTLKKIFTKNNYLKSVHADIIILIGIWRLH